MTGELVQIHTFLRQGNLLEAERLTREALRKNPFDGTLTDLLGVIARGRGDSRKAIELFKNAIAFESANALFRCHLAMALKSDGQTDAARAAFEAALQTDPDSFESAYNYALFLHDAGDAAAAIEMGRRAVRLDPVSAQAHNNLGAALQAAGRFEDAIVSYEKAIKCDPDHANAHANLSTTLAEADQVERALAVANRAVKRWPHHPDLLNARVNALARKNDYAAVVDAAEAVTAVDPAHAQAHYAKAIALLIQGDYATGLREFEWRVRRKNFWPKRSFASPRWTGEALADKTLFVQSEQGYGDTIQFCRFLPHLRALFDASPLHAGARIVFDCPTRLIPLMPGLGGQDVIDDFRAGPPPHDAHVYLMSLPWMLGVTFDSVPATVPYLTMPPPLPDAPVVAGGALNVGVTWASEHGADYRRKVCHATDLAPLFSLPGVRIHGLQFGADAAELAPYLASDKVIDLGPRLGGFAETAALVAKMDLIVSIDTYIVHLAAALGRPAWVMLPFSPDWRWGLERDDSPWYPTLRLFRQRRPGDWRGIVADVARALAERVGVSGRVAS